MTEVDDLDLLLAPGVFPPDSGGPATFAPNIGRSLARRGHSIRVVTNGTAPSGFDTEYPFEVVRISRRESVPLRYADQIRTLVQEIREVQPDLVFSNAFDLQAVTAARVTRTPLLAKIVGDNAWERARRGGLEVDIETFQRRRHGPKFEAFKLLRTLQTRGANHVAVPSAYLRDLVDGWGVSASDISVIYNSLDLDRRSIPESERAERITTVGRLVPWKGIEGIIEAFADVSADAELHIVGDGPERESLERQAAASGRRNDIVFHGRVEHRRVLELVSHSRVFTLNSTYEGLPHVVLEAMACGTPVVASAAGGTPEAVVDAESGCLVDAGDRDALARRIEQLLGDPDLRDELRRGAFEMLSSRFDHETMVDEYERLLLKVVER